MPFKNVSLKDLENDVAILDECVDFILDVFGDRGLNEDFEPNEHGTELENSVDYLMGIRYKFHDQTSK